MFWGRTPAARSGGETLALAQARPSLVSEWAAVSSGRKLVWNQTTALVSDLGDALRELAAVLKKLYRELRRDEDEAFNVMILSDLLVLREYWFEKVPSPAEYELVASTGTDLAMVDLCWRAASAAYGFTMNLAMGCFDEVAGDVALNALLENDAWQKKSQKDLFDATVTLRCGEKMVVKYRELNYNLYDGVARPNYFVGTYDNVVVVSVRGTMDVGDVFTDIISLARDFLPDITAHEGIANAADNVIVEAAPHVIKALAEIPKDARLVFTGHSLGAGVALLCAMQLKAALERPSGNKRTPLVNALAKAQRWNNKYAGTSEFVKAVTFSPPPVVSHAQNQASLRSAYPYLESYYCQDDAVPTLSFRGLLAFSDALDAVDAPYPFLKRWAYLTMVAPARHVLPFLGSSKVPPSPGSLVTTLDPVLQRCFTENVTRAATDPTAPLMSIPGTVFRMMRTDFRSPYRPHRDHVLVPTVKVQDRGLADHLPLSVNKAVSDLIAAGRVVGLTAPPPPPHKSNPVVTAVLAQAVPDASCVVATPATDAL